MAISLTSADLPAQWNAQPAPPELHEIEAKWLGDRQTAALAVPSVIVPFEWNYLLNPEHPDYQKTQIGKSREYRFDSRLSQR